MNELNEEEMLEIEGGAGYSDCVFFRETNDKVVITIGNGKNNDTVMIAVVRAWRLGSCTEAGYQLLTSGKSYVMNVTSKDNKVSKLKFELKGNKLTVTRSDHNITAFKIKVSTSKKDLANKASKVGEVFYKF